MLAKALARSIDCSVRRIQFTPDLLPSDITGRQRLQPGHPRLRVPPGRDLRQHRGRRRDQPGLARRPSPRCSSAWRSARSPSTARPTRSQPPFMVIATQNPIEMEGTYPLPEAQRDRFMARISMGYPVGARRARDARHATAGTSRSTTSSRSPTPPRSRKLIEAVREVYVAAAVQQYAVDLVTATRVERRPAPRRLAARHAAPAARRPGARRARRPRLRAARRRPGPRRAGARPPAHPHRRDPARAPEHSRRAARPPAARPGSCRRPLRRVGTVRRLRDLLTTRGRAFVSSGITLAVCGMGLGFADLTRIGVLLDRSPPAQRRSRARATTCASPSTARRAPARVQVGRACRSSP